jgi:hypothetical protein
LPPENKAPKEPVTWHAAFRDGIRLALFPYRDVLSFEFEHPLNTEPLRIDAVIIKKEPGVRIDTPLGAIFRGVNIIEYKSPGDYLSTGDYHKTGAYGRLYSVLNKVEPKDMTLSFVAGRRAVKLMGYLGGECGYKLKEGSEGIWYVEGDIFGGVQVVESKRLRGRDGIWLRGLRGGLKGGELREIIEMGRGMPEGAPLGAYMYRVIQANSEGLREIKAMSDVAFEEMLEEYGLTAKWVEQGWEQGREEGLEEGREEGLEEAVKRLQKHGMDPKEIAEVLELPLVRVFRYLETG